VKDALAQPQVEYLWCSPQVRWHAVLLVQLLAGAVVASVPMQSRLHVPCRHGTSAEFSAPPSELRLCLGESNAAELASQQLAPWLGGASGFQSAGVNFTIAMAPPEMFALASSADGDNVLAIVAARIPVADSIAGAKWFAQKAPLTDTAWSDCASDGLDKWQVCRQRSLPFSARRSLIESVRFSIGRPRVSDTTALVYVIHSKCLLYEVDC
jgi:hypothetical protein